MARRIGFPKQNDSSVIPLSSLFPHRVPTFLVLSVLLMTFSLAGGATIGGRNAVEPAEGSDSGGAGPVGWSPSVPSLLVSIDLPFSLDLLLPARFITGFPGLAGFGSAGVDLSAFTVDLSGGRGDLNGDGVVDAADAVLLAAILAGVVPFDASERWRADIDLNNQVDSVDLLLLQLAVTAMTPRLDRIDPEEVAAGETGVNLRAWGSPFSAVSVLRAANADLSTRFSTTDGGLLKAKLPDKLTAQGGTIPITVRNGSGPESNVIELRVLFPVPVLDSITPSVVSAGSPDTEVVFEGSAFDATGQAYADTTPLSTNWESTTRLRAVVPASLLTSERFLGLSVENPAPGGGRSNALSLHVTGGGPTTPVITGTTPSGGTAGSTGVFVRVYGTGFLPSSTLYVNGTPLLATYGSDVGGTYLQATLFDILTARAGTLNFQVENGTLISAPWPWTVSNPVPVITGASVLGFEGGGTLVRVRVAGSGFFPMPAGTLLHAGNGVYTPVSCTASELVAVVPTTEVPADRKLPLAAENPPPGGGMSNVFLLNIPVDNPLHADAGPAQSAEEGTLVTLDGTASTGPITTWQWTQVSGAPVTLTGANTSVAHFTLTRIDRPMQLQFQLTISNGTLTASALTSVYLYRKSAPFGVVILEPADGSQTSAGTVLVRGQLTGTYDPQKVGIVVDSKSAVWDGSEFRLADCRLNDGQNVIRVEAVDQRDMSCAHASVQVTFNPLSTAPPTDPLSATVLTTVFNAATRLPIEGARATVVGIGGRVLSTATGEIRFPIAGLTEDEPGRPFVLDVTFPGYLSAQRTGTARMSRFHRVPDVYLVPLSGTVTTVGPTGGTATDGTGRITMTFPAGALPMPVDVRLTEVPFGDALPNAMPATSMWTFAFDIEAGPLHETAVPVKVSMENFLGFDPGMPVPMGWYDRRAAKWFHDGMALVTTDGTRIEAFLSHFSFYDANATAAPPDPPVSGPGDDPCGPCPDCRKDPCKTECEDDTGQGSVGYNSGDFSMGFETPPYAAMGQPESLGFEYESQDVKDYAQFDVKVDYSGTVVPLTAVVKLDIDDKHYEQTFTVSGLQNRFTLKIPLRDTLGQAIFTPGTHPYAGTVESVYAAYYWRAYCFGCEPVYMTDVPLREPYRMRTPFSGHYYFKETPDLAASPFGAGWDLTLLGKLWRVRPSPDGEVVYLRGSGGDEIILRPGLLEKMTGITVDAHLQNCVPQPGDSAVTVHLDPLRIFSDGRGFIYHWIGSSPYCEQIRRAEGTIDLALLAGGGSLDVNLDTIPYIRALDVADLRMSMSREGYMTRNSAGELFFIDCNNMKKIYKLGLDGMIRPWAVLPYDAWVLDCDVLGNVYALCVSGSTSRIYKAIEGGGIAQIPTTAVPGFIWDIRVDKDLNIWALLANYGWSHDQIWRINPDGTAHPVVGHQSASSSPESVLADPVPAAQAFLSVYHQIRLDAQGRPLFSDNYSYSALGLSGDRIRRLDPDGLIRTVVDCRKDGSLPMDPGSGENYLAVNQVNAFYLYNFFLDETGEQLYLVGTRPGSGFHDIDVYRLSEKVLYFSSDLRYRYDKTTRTLDDLRNGERFLFDADGRQVGRTDLDGNTTGTGWDAQGKLVSVTDPKGGVTQLQYSDGTHLSRIVDPLGRETTFVINGAGDLTRVTLPDASVVQFEYDATHHITARTGADGRRTDYAWGGDGTRIASITFADGSVRLYHPDPENASVTDGNGHTWLYSADYTTGRVRTVTDPLGNATVKEHDPAGRVARVTEPGGRIREYGYDVMGNLIRETLLPANQTRRWAYHSYTGLPVSSTDELGRVTTFSYDTHRHLASRTMPDGAVTSYTYTADGLLASQTDPLGNATTYEYDLKGNLSKVTDPLGHFTSFTHDAAGNILSAADPNGNTTTFTYDVMNRKLTRTDPLGNTTTWTYAPSGKKGGCSTCAGGGDKVATVTDPMGNLTRFDYDAVGNLTKITDPLGFFRTMTYDPNRNLVSSTEEEGRVTTMEYDAANRLTKTTRPGGIIDQTAYDADGRMTSRTDPLGRVTGFEYDSAGRLSATVDPLGGRTTFAYDAAGNRLSVTDAKNHATTFTYDVLNRPLIETDPLGRTRSRTYDAAGHLASTTDAKGQTITLSYDDAGRLLSKNYPDSTQETYTYDNNGNLLRAVNPDVSIAYTYDPRNLQLTIKNETIDKTVSYTYDAMGRKVSLTYPDGERIEYARNTQGQISVLSSNGNGGLDPMTPVVNYAYNPTGSLSTMDYAFGMHVSRTYDPATGRLVDLKYTKPDTSVISDFAYTYDLAGNILTKTTDFGLITYGYDAKDQLTSAQYTWKPAETFDYDAVGNRTLDVGNPVWHYDAGNQLLAYGTGVHDPTGQTPPTTSAFTFTYDANGSIVDQTPAVGDSISFTYDSDNRVKSLQENGELFLVNVFDAYSHRVKETMYSGGIPTNIRWFVYGGEGLLAEYDGSGSLLRKHTWHGDRPWATDCIWQSDFLPTSKLYVISDHLTIPHSLLDLGFNQVWRGDWLSFGSVLEFGINEQILRFPGQVRLDLSNEFSSYDNWHRVYNAASGRYLQKDRIKYSNYLYVNNKPNSYIDPTGLIETNFSKTNCLGFAVGRYFLTQPDVTEQESLDDVLTECGYSCNRINSSKECRCFCENGKIVLYIYKYGHNTWGSDPFLDPWIPHRDNDFHSFRWDANTGTWYYVDHAMPIPGLPNTIDDPDNYWKNGPPKYIYCCCKKPWFLPSIRE